LHFQSGVFLQDFLIDKNRPQNLIAWIARILLLIALTSFTGTCAAPVSLNGVYNADSEITTKTDGSKVAQGVKLALKLEFTELNGTLKGNLTATTRDSFIPLTFVFGFNGKLSNSLIRLKVNVGICLESPA
jgi:hypothetical protein